MALSSRHCEESGGSRQAKGRRCDQATANCYTPCLKSVAKLSTRKAFTSCCRNFLQACFRAHQKHQDDPRGLGCAIVREGPVCVLQGPVHVLQAKHWPLGTVLKRQKYPSSSHLPNFKVDKCDHDDLSPPLPQITFIFLSGLLVPEQ